MGMRIVIALDPTSAEARAYERHLAPFGDRVAVRYVGPGDLAGAVVDAEILVGQRVASEIFARAERLRWFSSWAAGIETVVTPELLARGVAVTNASGVHGPNIAEHVLGMMLMFTRDLHGYVRRQLTHQWQREPSVIEELSGKTLLIVGLGRIGEALAERARSFGMRVVGVKRDPSKRHDSDVAVDAVVGFDGLDAALVEAHHVVVAVPLTETTRGMFDARRLGLMRRDAYFYNIARGGVVDEPALIAALRAKAIAGAGLDVFAEEPLPPTSALWELPNVIITPHIAGVTPHYYDRAARLFAENLERYLAKEPLENLYQASRGY